MNEPYRQVTCSLPRLSLGFAVAALVAAGSADAAEFHRNARVHRAPETGRIGFVATERGKPIPRPQGFTATSRPAAVGKAFLDRHRAALGLGQAATLRALRSHPQPRGGTAVRYQQRIEGIDVLGGELSVQLDRDNNVLSMLGEAEPERPAEMTPGLEQGEAERTAIAYVSREEGVHAARLQAEDTALRIFDNRIVGGPGRDEARLVWATHVGDGLAVRRLVLVDAQDGLVAASIDETPEAGKQRSVCDAANGTAHVPCTSPLMTETQGYGGPVQEVRDAFRYAGATYDFFFSRFGRDSLDGAGLPLRQTIRFCTDDKQDDCPYVNAYWDTENQQMVYGEGFASADDVVAHELAHGLTEHTSNLFYYFQSGAINESLSDIFGELIDQATASGADGGAFDWKIGENLPIGTLRDMKDPSAFGDPDSMTSPDYYDGEDDSGGVHRNSGVANKAAYLMIAGGSFGGETITAIGAEKTARVFYAVQTGFLTSGSDFRDLGFSLGQACDNLVGSAGITAADCAEVRKAVQATRMQTERPAATDDVPACAAGRAPAYVFADTVENEANWFVTRDLWDAATGYATSGRFSLWGRNADDIGDSSLPMSRAVAIPQGAFLQFSHAYDFDHDSTGAYDGGVVEASTSGSAWTDVIPAADYTSVLPSGFGNPLANRRAFTGASHGFRTTIVPLTALAGQNARIRFRIGTDNEFGGLGWLVDDVGIYSCVRYGSFSVDAAASSAREGGAGSVVVSRAGGDGDATVLLRSAGGTATPGSDYTPIAVPVKFTGAQTTATVPLAVLDDAVVDGPETIDLSLSDPVGGTIGSASSSLTISDNDVAPTVDPADPADRMLEVTGARATRNRITLRVAVPAAGMLALSGKAGTVRFKATRVQTEGSRTVTVRFRMSATLKRLLRRRAVKAAFTARFRPTAGGDSLSARRTLKLKRRH